MKEVVDEVVINTKEVESVWEKDGICFVRMRSGKTWLCELNCSIYIPEFDDGSGHLKFKRFNIEERRTINCIMSWKGFIRVPLIKDSRGE